MTEKTATRTDDENRIQALEIRCAELERALTESRSRADALQDAEKRYRLLYERAPPGYQSLDENGRFLNVNQAWLDTLGYTHDELIGQNAQILYATREEFTWVGAEKYRQISERGTGTVETRWVRKDGTVIDILLSSTPLDLSDLSAGVTFTALDITERKHAEEELKQYADTQGVLVREVNHRIKNNLSAIISMLHMEEDRATAANLPAYLPVLRDLVGRVEGLATVHSLLSATGWRPLMLSDLCDQVIKAALKGLPLTKTIQLEVHTSPLCVNSSQAHHLTLIINELATNSVKYALRGRNKARIEVDVSFDGEMLQIRFRDDGPGYPDEMIVGDLRRASVGLDLIHGIASKTLRGTVSLSNDAGAVTQFSFKPEFPPHRRET